MSSCMDFRWAFHQVASAKAFFVDLKDNNSEMQPGLGALRCSPEPDVNVEGVDELLVTRTRPAPSEQKPTVALCCVLRVGRVCAKLYLCGITQPGRDLERRILMLLADLSQVIAAIARRVKAAGLRAEPAGRVDLSEEMAAVQLQQPVMGSWLPEGDND